MSSTLHPTEQALRLHRSHLATSHRAPLAPRAAGERGHAPPRSRRWSMPRTVGERPFLRSRNQADHTDNTE